MFEWLKSWTWNQKISSAFFVNVLWCNISSWNCYHTHYIYYLIYMIFHVEMIFRQCNVKIVENISRRSKNHVCTCKKSTLISCRCNVCDNTFKMKCYIRKHLQKKHLIFFASKFKISTFQTSFTKSKTSRNEK